jgi:hypothetical protein
MLTIRLGVEIDQGPHDLGNGYRTAFVRVVEADAKGTFQEETCGINGISMVYLITLTLVPFEAQSLRSHALCLFIKCVHFLVKPSVLRLRSIAAAQFFERLLNGELVDFSHVSFSLDDKKCPAIRYSQLLQIVPFGVDQFSRSAGWTETALIEWPRCPVRECLSTVNSAGHHRYQNGRIVDLGQTSIL